MLKKNYSKIILFGVLFAAYLAFDHWKHEYDRPWAYSDGPVLLGKWNGSFQDPDGISKKIEMEILEPERQPTRRKQTARKHSRTEEFKGYAKIESKLGVEDDRIDGKLNAENWHRIERISFMPSKGSEMIPESFNVSFTEPGSWEGDVIRTTLIFTYRTKTGSSYSDSGDPRYSKKVPLALHRVK